MGFFALYPCFNSQHLSLNKQPFSPSQIIDNRNIETFHTCATTASFTNQVEQYPYQVKWPLRRGEWAFGIASNERAARDSHHEARCLYESTTSRIQLENDLSYQVSDRRGIIPRSRKLALVFQAEPRGLASERLLCLRLYACTTDNREPRPRSLNRLGFETKLFG